MLHAYGGVKNLYVVPTDEELGIAAWAVAEQWEQRAQLFSVLKRGFERHGWIANGSALDVQAAAAFARLPSMALPLEAQAYFVRKRVLHRTRFQRIFIAPILTKQAQ